MTTVVIRSRKEHTKSLFELSDDARQRIREYLKSAGIEVERTQPLIWPDDAVSACREHMYAPWEFTTKADIRQKRRERMEHHLWWKREYGVTQIRPLYVWVFWCPGVSGIFYRGWWLYIIGIGGVDYGGKYLGQDTEKVRRLMELFPLVEPKLFDSPDLRKWKAEFVKCYKRGYWCGKPQGKSPIWAEVKGSRIVRIISRAEWPRG